MQTEVNDYEVMFGKDIFKTVTMLQIGAPGADSLREVAAIMKEATLQQFSTFENRNEEVLQYQNARGDPGLIYYLSKYLTEEIYREPVDSVYVDDFGGVLIEHAPLVSRDISGCPVSSVSILVREGVGGRDFIECPVYYDAAGISKVRASITDVAGFFQMILGYYIRSRQVVNCPLDADLYITNGASAGVWELLIRFLQPGDTVFCEDPSYKAFIPHLRASQYELVGIPRDEEGMNLEILEEKLKQLKVRTPNEKFPFTAVVYVIPVFHNPTTRNMASDRKRKLVELARKYDLLVISDDVYNLLCYSSPESDDPNTAQPPKRIFAYDNKKDPDYKGNVISSGTFSKFLAPGLRVGWYELPQRLHKLQRNHYIFDSGAGKNPYSGALVGVALKMGLVKTHVKKTRVMYAERIKAAHEIIISSVGKLGVKCQLPSGGAFLWIELPNPVTADDVLQSSKSSVRFLPGGSASPTGSSKNCIRICITYYEIKELLAGVKDLCGFIQQAIEKARL